jgi:hypothetical protein
VESVPPAVGGLFFGQTALHDPLKLPIRPHAAATTALKSDSWRFTAANRRDRSRPIDRRTTSDLRRPQDEHRLQPQPRSRVGEHARPEGGAIDTAV